MIVGRLCEIENYGIYSDEIKKGIAFLKQLSPEMPAGFYDIEEGIFANVMEYQTDTQDDILYEAPL